MIGCAARRGRIEFTNRRIVQFLAGLVLSSAVPGAGSAADCSVPVTFSAVPLRSITVTSRET